MVTDILYLTKTVLKLVVDIVQCSFRHEQYVNLSCILSVFLLFLQYRYVTDTAVFHVTNTEYRYCTEILHTARGCLGRIYI